MTEEALPAIVVAPSVVAGEGSRNPFTNANFRKWWMASIVAGTGVGIQAVTVPLFIRDRVSSDHRAIAIAAALICQTLPGAFFALIGGVVADRVERRRILVRTYAVAALVSTTYVVLSSADIRVILPVFFLAAVVGSAGAFTNPARQSMIPQMVSHTQLQNAVIMGTMAFMATLQFGGPTLGGVLADGPGLTFAFGTEVVMLSLAAFFFSRIATDVPIPTGKNVRGDLVDGIRYIRTERAILGLLCLGTVPGIFLLGPFAVTNVLMVQDVLKESDKFVGITWGCFGAGILLGSVVMTVVRVRRRGLLLCCSVLFGGTAFALYGSSSLTPVSLALLVFSGAVGPAIFINFAVALIQENVEPRMMGRVMSMYSLAFTASTPVGYAQAGVVSSLFGPQATIISSAIAAAIIGVLAIAFLHPVRRLP